MPFWLLRYLLQRKSPFGPTRRRPATPISARYAKWVAILWKNRMKSPVMYERVVGTAIIFRPIINSPGKEIHSDFLSLSLQLKRNSPNSEAFRPYPKIFFHTPILTWHERSSQLLRDIDDFVNFRFFSVLIYATMSLRPNARTEGRRSRYKVAVDAEEGRRRREDNMVEIRKNRREENLLKKRREGLQPQQLQSTVNAPQLDKKVTVTVRLHFAIIGSWVWIWSKWIDGWICSPCLC